MTETRTERAVLLADITGSTPLYESIGDDEAARQIGECIDWMRELIETREGTFVSAKGDDVLATFASPDQALGAVEAILAKMPYGGLSVHAGLHFGWIISMRGDIFGDAVNMTARLASLANPGEVLISRELAERLSQQNAAALRPLNPINVKGKSEPVEVLSLNEGTRFFSPGAREAEDRAFATAKITVVIEVEGEDRRFIVEDGSSISMGRLEDNVIVLDRPWVSRHHATIAVNGGRVQFTDRSTYGSYLLIGDGHELVAQRESVVLVGSGRIGLGTSLANPEAAILTFDVSTADG